MSYTEVSRGSELDTPVSDSLFRRHNGTQHIFPQLKLGHDLTLLPGTDNAAHLNGSSQKCHIGDIGFDPLQTWNTQCYDVCYNIDFSRIHPAAAQALALLPTARPQDMTKIIAYTDGTGGSVHDGDDGPQPAWAIILLGADIDFNMYFCGVWCGKVINAGAYVETLDKLTNNVAEATAVIWTILYVMQLPQVAAIDIVTDSDLTIGTAEGVYSNSSNQQVGGILTELWKAISHLKFASLFHVLSHQEDPYNELADSIATLAARGEIDTPMPFHIRQQLHFHAPWQWLWLRYADDHTRNAYPDVVDHAFEFSPCRISCEGVHGPAQHYQHKEKVTKGPVLVKLSLVTINSRTLNPSGQMYFKNGTLVPTINDTGKAAAYRAQFIDAKKSIIGVLEARSKQGTRHSRRMLVYASGAASGNWGCELHVIHMLPNPPKSGFFMLSTSTFLSPSPLALSSELLLPRFVATYVLLMLPMPRSRVALNKLSDGGTCLPRGFRTMTTLSCSPMPMPMLERLPQHMLELFMLNPRISVAPTFTSS